MAKEYIDMWKTQWTHHPYTRVDRSSLSEELISSITTLNYLASLPKPDCVSSIGYDDGAHSEVIYYGHGLDYEYMLAGTLENNCGVMFLQNLGVGMDSMKLQIEVLHWLKKVAKLSPYVRIMAGTAERQNAEKTLPQVGFTVLDSFRSPRTGSLCTLWKVDL